MAKASAKSKAPMALGLLLVLTAALLILPFLISPKQFANSSFLLSDCAHPLWMADQFQAGTTIYRDYFTPYGPLNALLYGYWSGMTGNSPLSWVAYQSLFVFAAVILAWKLLSRFLTPAWAALFVAVAVLPFLLTSFYSAYYMGLERVAWLTAALLWKPGNQATPTRLISAGFLMGSTASIKFGGGFLLLAAWLLTDFFLTSLPLKQRLLTALYLGLGFGLFYLIWAAALFSQLPASIALDTLWPMYVTQTYTYNSAIPRWPAWQNLNYFLGFQIGPLLGLMLFLYGLASYSRWFPLHSEKKQAASVGGVVFIGILFLLGVAVYFKHVWHFNAAFWMLCLAASCLFQRLPAWGRIAILLIWLPAFYLKLKSDLSPDDPRLVAVDFGARGKLWMDQPTARQVEKTRATLNELRAQNPRARDILAFPQAGGWSHFCGTPLGTRHSWFGRGLIRPGDDAALIKSLDETSAVIVNEWFPSATPPSSDPASWNISSLPAWSPAFKAAFQQRMGPPIRMDDCNWVFPVVAIPRPGEASPH